MPSTKPDPVLMQIRDALPPLTQTEHSRGYRDACECICRALRQAGHKPDQVIGVALAAYNDADRNDDVQVTPGYRLAGDGEVGALRSWGLL